VAELDVIRQLGGIRVIWPGFQHHTEIFGFAANRLANTEPAAPPPMITTSYFIDPPAMLCLLSWDISWNVQAMVPEAYDHPRVALHAVNYRAYVGFCGMIRLPMDSQGT
jgi:hypothetical protein